jgi:hypothetical protein
MRAQWRLQTRRSEATPRRKELGARNTCPCSQNTLSTARKANYAKLDTPQVEINLSLCLINYEPRGGTDPRNLNLGTSCS